MVLHNIRHWLGIGDLLACCDFIPQALGSTRGAWGARRRPSECWRSSRALRRVLTGRSVSPDSARNRACPCPGPGETVPRDSGATCGARSWDWLCRGESLGSAESVVGTWTCQASGRSLPEHPGPGEPPTEAGTPDRDRPAGLHCRSWWTPTEHVQSLPHEPAEPPSCPADPAACTRGGRAPAGWAVAEGQAPRQRGVRTERRGCLEAGAWPGPHSGVLPVLLVNQQV